MDKKSPTADAGKQETNAPSDLQSASALTPKIPPVDPAPKSAKAPKVSIPESVKLESHFSFFDEANEFFQWVEGFVETDIGKIKLLIERKAPIVAVPAQVTE